MATKKTPVKNKAAKKKTGKKKVARKKVVRKKVAKPSKPVEKPEIPQPESEPEPEEDPNYGPGRLSLYDPKYVQLLFNHFNVEPTRIEEETIVVKDKVFTVRNEKANPLPTLAGFAIKIGVHRGTLLAWAKDHPDFDYMYKLAKEYQEHILVQNGLMGRYDKTFAIFASKNLIDWRDKTEAKVGATDEFQDFLRSISGTSLGPPPERGD